MYSSIFHKNFNADSAIEQQVESLNHLRKAITRLQMFCYKGRTSFI